MTGFQLSLIDFEDALSGIHVEDVEEVEVPPFRAPEKWRHNVLHFPNPQEDFGQGDSDRYSDR